MSIGHFWISYSVILGEIQKAKAMGFFIRFLFCDFYSYFTNSGTVLSYQVSAQKLPAYFAIKQRRPGTVLPISAEGELAVPQSGRRSFRPTANFSRPRDTSHGLSSNIEALDTVYHTGGGRIGGAAKREEVVPTYSQFLQAQGLLTSFVLKYRGPGHIISYVRDNGKEGDLRRRQPGAICIFSLPYDTLRIEFPFRNRAFT